MEQVGFDKALPALIAGKRVARMGWNGKGLWIYHIPASTYPAQTEAARRNLGAFVPYGAYLAIKSADGTVVPWVASQSDILGKDWVILDETEASTSALAA